MKISYLACRDGKKLFSFHVHDYRDYTDAEGNYYFIDGGDSYVRHGGEGHIVFAEIAEVIQDIREEMTWGKNYDKNNNKLPETEYILLKDLSTAHILNILKYFTEKLQDSTSVTESWRRKHCIFLEELIYREELLTKET